MGQLGHGQMTLGIRAIQYYATVRLRCHEYWKMTKEVGTYITTHARALAAPTARFYTTHLDANFTVAWQLDLRRLGLPTTFKTKPSSQRNRSRTYRDNQARSFLDGEAVLYTYILFTTAGAKKSKSTRVGNCMNTNFWNVEEYMREEL